MNRRNAFIEKKKSRLELTCLCLQGTKELVLICSDSRLGSKSPPLDNSTVAYVKILYPVGSKMFIVKLNITARALDFHNCAASYLPMCAI